MGGATGAALVLVGAWTSSLTGVLLGNLLLGAGNTAVMLSRYVVADLAPVRHRGRAISTSLLTITVGAVAGPNLLGPTSHLAHLLALPAPAGLYVISLVAFSLAPALLVGAVRRRPGMRQSARSCETAPEPPERSGRGGVGSAIAVLTSANATMVAIMAVAPAHLHTHGHGLGLVGLVVSLHIGAMYAASPLLGRVSDRIGERRLAVVGAVGLATVGLSPLVVGTSPAAVVLLLVLLGVGWNVQVLAGSAMLTAAVPARRRALLEARGELSMSLGAAFAGLVLAGPLVTAGGIPLLAAATALLNLPLALLLLRPELTGPRPREATTVMATP